MFVNCMVVKKRSHTVSSFQKLLRESFDYDCFIAGIFVRCYTSVSSGTMALRPFGCHCHIN